ncbi:hypothetical protein CCOS2040_18555 [Streptomyces albidoflavus]|nr:hypothetical protein CCOS2040_18555 [Streptomyces albidoflavus]
MPDDERGQFLGEAPEAADAVGGEQVEVDADVDAAVAEVPVRGAAQPVVGEQGAEVAQVRAEPGGRHRAVLPAGPRLGAVGHPGGGAGGVLADPPEGALAGGVVDDEAVGGVGGPRQRLGVAAGLGAGGAAGLHEEPGAAPGQAARVGDEVGGHPLDGERGVRQQAGGGLGGGGLVGVAEDGQRAGGRGLDQADGGLGDQAEGALGAAEEAGQVGAAFGEQGVQGVAGDAARQFGVAGAEQGEVAVDEVAQAVGGSGPVARGEVVGGAPVGTDVEGVDVVGGRPPGDRVGAAGVVADHPAEGAAAVRGGVGAEGEAVRGGGVAEPVEDQAGLDAGGACLGVEGEQAVHMPGEVEDDAGAGGLPGDGGARAPGDHGHAVLPADREGGGHVVGVARGDRAERHAPVVGGVHGVQGAGGDGEVGLAGDPGGQRTGQVGAEDLFGGGGGGGMGGPRSGAAWAGAGGRSRRTVTPVPTVRTGPPRVRVA